jgi:DNA-binding CsgD family transcriptional regulator
MFHTDTPPDGALATPPVQRPAQAGPVTRAARPAPAAGLGAVPGGAPGPSQRGSALPARPPGAAAAGLASGVPLSAAPRVPNTLLGSGGANSAHSANSPYGPINPLAMRQVLEALGHGLLLLGRRGRVLYANGAAQLACRPGGPLVLHGQQLLACEADAELWAQTLAAAERGQWSMQLLRQGEHTLSVGVVPLRTDDLTAADEPRVLLVLGSQGLPAGLSLQLFCRQHRLTGAESQVMAALHQGLSPETVAADTGVAISTVRTHIAAIRHKTRSPSLRALLQSVAHLPALRGISG